MNGMKRRVLKLEARQRGRFSAWLRQATDKELDTRIRELVAKWKGCKPAEVDMSPESIETMMTEIKAELCSGLSERG